MLFFVTIIKNKMKSKKIELFTFAIKTILLIIIFLGFPFFLGVIAFNYYAEATSLVSVPDIERL